MREKGDLPSPRFSGSDLIISVPTTASLSMISFTSSVDGTSASLKDRYRSASTLIYGSSESSCSIKGTNIDDSSLRRAYPSPPMSQSPTVASKEAKRAEKRESEPRGMQYEEQTSLRLETSSNTTSVGERGKSITPLSPQQSSKSPASQTDPNSRYRRHGSSLPHIITFSSQPSQPCSRTESIRRSSSAAGHNTEAHPGSRFDSDNPASNDGALPSPRSQRKAKGHVASACVPCKRAHLRCDAQRPCARCMSNGKEDACIDVQHKKRGRPRLRDDRDSRYQQLKLPYPQETVWRGTSRTRIGSSTAAFQESAQQYQSYGSQDPGISNRSSSSNAGRLDIRGDLLHSSGKSYIDCLPEPMAYLTMNLTFVKVSPTFTSIIGGMDITNRKLLQLAVPSEGSKVLEIENMLHYERKRREPNYLPPILGRGDGLIQRLGFGAPDVARCQLPHSEYLTFTGHDGHPRTHLLRIGLVKVDSFYYAVVLLSQPSSRQSPEPPLRRREVSERPESSLASSVLPAYSYSTSAPVGQDLYRHRFGEGSAHLKRPSELFGHLSARPSPVMDRIIPSYAPTATRSQHFGQHSHQPPQGGLSSRDERKSDHLVQLPPIRAPSDSRQPHGESDSRRNHDSSGRFKIDRLVDNYDSHRHH